MEPHPRIECCLHVLCRMGTRYWLNLRTAFFPFGYSSPAVMPIMVHSEQGLRLLVGTRTARTYVLGNREIGEV